VKLFYSEPQDCKTLLWQADEKSAKTRAGCGRMRRRWKLDSPAAALRAARISARYAWRERQNRECRVR
jgi:hypothetical protein